jgi:S1-C subfamily serine protease
MEIQWQVYSAEEGKVVAKITSFGFYSTEGRSDDIVERLLNGAFKRAAEEFARDPALVRTIRTGLPTLERTAPLTPMTVAMPAARSTPIARAGAAVVSVVVADGHGSGVLVSGDGYILTNRHVAGDGGGKVKVVWADGSESPGQVLRADRKRDVALIKVETPSATPLALRHDQPQLGETVFAIGTPLEKQLAGTLTRGIVSGLRINEGQPFIQSDVVINHGNSGGPLLDEKGQVIGLAVMGFESGGAPMGINFFIPIDDALKVLQITPRILAEAAPPKPAPARPTSRPSRPSDKVTSRR